MKNLHIAQFGLFVVTPRWCVLLCVLLFMLAKG